MKKWIFYTLFISVGGNCFAQLTANAGGDRHFCTYPDSSNQLIIGGTPTASGGVAPYTYEWSIEPFDLYPGSNISIITSYVLDDSTIANPNVVDFTVRESFKFKLKVIDNIGQIASDSCVISFSSFAKNLMYYEYSVFYGDSVFLTKDLNVGWLFGNNDSLIYEWNHGESLSDSTLKTNFWAKPDTTTWYSVKITDKHGCEAQGDPYYHVIVQTLGVEENELSGVSIYPNPANEIIYIENENTLINRVEVLNLTGVSVLQYNGKEISSIDINPLPKGIYFIIMFSDEKLVYKSKIIRK